MRQRFLRVISVLAALLAVGITYAVICSHFEAGIPCIFHRVTGLLCPGCGVSRMCLCLLRLDIGGAWSANPAILVLLPPGGAVAADITVRYIKTGRPAPKGWSGVALWVMILGLLTFGVIRNVV